MIRQRNSAVHRTRIGKGHSPSSTQGNRTETAGTAGRKSLPSTGAACAEACVLGKFGALRALVQRTHGGPLRSCACVSRVPGIGSELDVRVRALAEEDATATPRGVRHAVSRTRLRRADPMPEVETWDDLPAWRQALTTRTPSVPAPGHSAGAIALRIRASRRRHSAPERQPCSRSACVMCSTTAHRSRIRRSAIRSSRCRSCSTSGSVEAFGGVVRGGSVAGSAAASEGRARARSDAPRRSSRRRASRRSWAAARRSQAPKAWRSAWLPARSATAIIPSASVGKSVSSVVWGDSSEWSVSAGRAFRSSAALWVTRGLWTWPRERRSPVMETESKSPPNARRATT